MKTIEDSQPDGCWQYLPGSDTLSAWLTDARARTLALVADLSDEQLMGSRLAIVNPLLWEIGHVAWFYERWVLRQACGRRPLLRNADSLWDSIAIAHDTRWDLPLPPRKKTLEYMDSVQELVLGRLCRGPLDPQLAYFVLYSVCHEDMHTEAFTYTRQTLGYPVPELEPGRADSEQEQTSTEEESVEGDVEIPGGTFSLGAPLGAAFVFDNEKWAHPVEIRPFRLSKTAVTEDQFLAFVEDNGYQRRELWHPQGWGWCMAAGAEHPVYWRRDGGGAWLRRHFDRWVPLKPRRPVLHVSWFEADAFCRWAGRRLPSEVEWEAAAAWERGRVAASLQKRYHPWGQAPPSPERANLDGAAGGCVDVDALGAGDSALGCRQLTGNVWEWTATAFEPYPGFIADPYKEYSQPWFRTHMVLRGGCWATRSRLVRNTLRNFYTPDRRDVWAGLRTAAANPHNS